MMNNRGGMVLRNIIFITIIFTGIIAFASIAINDIADKYNNTNMSSSYNQDTYGVNELKTRSDIWKGISEKLTSGNLIKMLDAGLEGLGVGFIEVLTAPITLGNMVTSVLKDLAVPDGVANIFKYIIAFSLYVLITFVIYSAFLKGGKL